MNNEGLVLYAKKALEEKWGYVWGTFGRVLTSDLLSQKVSQYPNGVGGYYDFIKAHWLGKKSVDCVGLIKGYYWGAGNYVASTDVNADMMYRRASEKGTISNMPDIEGLCVHKDGHIGVYIGNGQVIEAHGTKYGVILTPLHGGTDWTHWLKCPYIDYVAESKPNPTIPNQSGYRTVTASVLNVRDGQGTNNKIIGQLKRGEKVRIGRDFSSGWSNIYFGNHGGFVASRYIK